LQGRLDDSGDADCNLVLELEYVLERAVETVGPEMGAVTGVARGQTERLREKPFGLMAEGGG
jgi:hypothetical protein